MSNLNNSKFGKFLSSKGFYIALAVCIVGAGAAAWVAVDATMNSISTQDEKKLENTAPISQPSESMSSSSRTDWGFSELQEAENKLPGVTLESSSAADKTVQKAQDPPVSSAASASSGASSSSASSQPAADAIKKSGKGSSSQKQPEQQQSLVFSLPILSEVFNPYSGGELVKNKTLNDWRTHDGIDIKAEKGTDIMACADGKISRIYDDALWGTCMEIEHSGGMLSVYCGIEKASITLKEGDEVKVKDAIGKVDKIPCEISLDSHLHFGLKQGGKWVDPVTAMGLK